MTYVVRSCSGCGARFEAYPTKGRPRSRCDACRSNHARLDGVAWRRLRAEVLAQEPACAVAGCGRLSTEVDHVIPLQLRPDLGLVRANLRGICGPHNASKGARVNGQEPVEAAGRGTAVEKARRVCICGDSSCPGRWHL